MPKKSTVSAIDVGTSKIAAIMADAADEASFQVLGVGVAASKGLRKGVVVNPDEAREAVHEAIKKAEHAAGIKMETAYVGITGRHVNSLNTKSAVAVTRSDRVVSAGDLKRVLESAREVNSNAERRLLHVIPRGYTLDGQDGVKNPIGMHGFRLDVEAHVVTAATSSVQNLLKCVRGIGVDVEDLVLEPLASSEAVLRADEREAGVLMADIGAGTTDVALFKEGSIWHTSVLPVGGYQITRDIAIGLGVPFEIAEEIKKKYGTLLDVPQDKEGSGEKIDGASLGLDNGQQILVQDVNDIIRARIDELLRMLQLEMPSANLEALIPAGMVLTGGTSNLPGIDAVATDVFRTPVRIGVPKDVYGLADILYDPAYATAVGLLMWGARRYSEDEGTPAESAAANMSKGLRRFVNKAKHWVNL
ncbi:MAG: cell division protein FtsA [Chloroflexi bacterium]|nr:cell division protein FtsA [Chloroflexota bacterium]